MLHVVTNKNCVVSPVHRSWSGFQIVVARRVHEGADTWAGRHVHMRTGGPTAQGLMSAIVQRSREEARAGVVVERSLSRGGGSVVVCPFQKVHSGDPSRPPALLRVHGSKGGTQWSWETWRGESLQLWEGCTGAGCEYWSRRLSVVCWAVPEQHHSTTGLISNMI